MAGIYFEDYPDTLQPERSAFDRPGAPLDDAVCIYMSNRYEGRWSYLLPNGFEKQRDPAERIPIGYTQLWILQPLWVEHVPSEATAPSLGVDAIAPYQPDIDRDEYLSVFHVFREPGPDPRDHRDHVGLRRSFDDAVAVARAHARHARRNTMVARILEDWQWH